MKVKATLKNTEISSIRKTAEEFVDSAPWEKRAMLKKAASYFLHEAWGNTREDSFRLNCQTVRAIINLGVRKDLGVLDVMYKEFLEIIKDIESGLREE